MERSTTLIMALVAVSLLIIPAQLAFASAGPLMLSGSTWGSQSSPMAVEPGSTYVPYTVYLSNAGQYPVENASIELYPTYPLNFSPGAASEVNFTLIPPGATVPAVFYMNVAPGASDGIYNISSFVNYTVVVGNSTIHSTEVYNFTQRLQVPVTLYARPVAYLAYWGSQSSPTAYPGMQHGVLTVVVGNSGTGPAYNASILISVKYPIRLVTDNVSVGTIPPGAQIPVSFIAGVSLNATTGDYPVNVTIHYNDGLTASAVVYAPVSLAPSISVQGYGIAQGNVFPGDNDVVLQVYLVNVGNTTAQDASAVVSLPAPLEPAYPGSTQEVVGMLPPGQPVPLSFRFDVPSSASSPEDLYVPLNVSYEGGSVSFLIPIHISSLANFSSEPYSMSALSQGASNVKISYMITNDGNASAKLVSAQLVLPSGLSGNTFTYVGDLSPGQSSLATFSLDVSSGTPVGDYAAILELTWIQSNAPGRQFTQEIPVEFHVSEGYVQLLESWFTSASGIEMLVLVVVVIAAVVLAVSLARTRRSR
ncbi:MAG TPA: hypothetical protein ENO38_02240 [Nitrososphaeria archaeon]|nr:hypothetical protein [Nitrososphaeria archaeon]